MRRQWKIPLIFFLALGVVLVIRTFVVRPTLPLLDVKVVGATNDASGNKHCRVRVENGSDRTLLLMVLPKVLDDEHSRNITVSYEKALGKDSFVLTEEKSPAIVYLNGAESRQFEVIVAGKIRPTTVIFRGVALPSDLEQALVRIWSKFGRRPPSDDVEMEF